MATAEYRISRMKRKDNTKSYKEFQYVRLTMTPNEHNDMLVAMALACKEVNRTSKNKGGMGSLAYLQRLRKLYDDTFKPSKAHDGNKNRLGDRISAVVEAEME